MFFFPITDFLWCQGSHNHCSLSSPRSRGRGRGRRRFGTGRRPGRPPKFLCLDPPLEPSVDKTAVREIWMIFHADSPHYCPRAIQGILATLKTFISNKTSYFIESLFIANFQAGDSGIAREAIGGPDRGVKEWTKGGGDGARGPGGDGSREPAYTSRRDTGPRVGHSAL